LTLQQNHEFLAERMILVVKLTLKLLKLVEIEKVASDYPIGEIAPHIPFKLFNYLRA